MNIPHPTQQGMIGFALTSALLQGLVEKGVLTSADELAVIRRARESLAKHHFENARLSRDWLLALEKAHPLVKEVE